MYNTIYKYKGQRYKDVKRNNVLRPICTECI